MVRDAAHEAAELDRPNTRLLTMRPGETEYASNRAGSDSVLPLLIFLRAAQQPLQRALLASAAPLLETRCGGALDLFRRPRLSRTEVANAAGKKHGKRLGERHGIGLIARLRNALG